MALGFRHVLSVLLVLLPFLGEIRGQEEALCKGVALNMTPEQKAVISDCLTEAGIQSIFKLPVKALGCFKVCLLKRKKLLTEDGKLDHDKIFAYVDTVMRPEEVKKPLKDGMDKCYKEHGNTVSALDDPTCASFAEVGLCVQNVFLEVCMS